LASRRSILSSGIAASFLFLVDPAMAAHRIAPERHLHLYNPHSGERFRDVYWSRGRYVGQAFHRVDRLMRDNYNGDMHAIDPALLDLLYALQLKTEAGFRPIQVNSGYRSRETNEMLREEGYGAVPDSRRAPRSFAPRGGQPARRRRWVLSGHGFRPCRYRCAAALGVLSVSGSARSLVAPSPVRSSG
jgi:hypothetical protein